MEEKEYIRYYELFTEEGPLYIYARYQSDPNKPFNTEIPEIYEFFTQKQATRGYDAISFFDGKAVFKREEKNPEGITTTSYMRLLTPSAFLGKVLPFIEEEGKSKEKAQEVQRILENRANNITTRKIVVEPPKVSEEQKDKISQKILAKYLK